MEKIDYKKEYKDLYLPKTNPMLIDVPRKLNLRNSKKDYVFK